MKNPNWSQQELADLDALQVVNHIFMQPDVYRALILSIHDGPNPRQCTTTALQLIQKTKNLHRYTDPSERSPGHIHILGTEKFYCRICMVGFDDDK